MLWRCACLENSVVSLRLDHRSELRLVELAGVETIPSVIHHNVQRVVKTSFIAVHIHGRNIAFLLVFVQGLEL